MKIIAKRAESEYERDSDVFIVEITLGEIKKVSGKVSRGWGDSGLTKKLLSPGMEYEIANGYDFRQDILSAVNAMTEAHKKFSAATTTMHGFARLVGQQGETEEIKEAQS